MAQVTARSSGGSQAPAPSPSALCGCNAPNGAEVPSVNPHRTGCLQSDRSHAWPWTEGGC